MINLDLPTETRTRVKSDIIRYAPLEVKQKQMSLLVEYLPSSLLEKVVIHQYLNYLKKSFNMNDEATFSMA